MRWRAARPAASGCIRASVATALALVALAACGGNNPTPTRLDTAQQFAKRLQDERFGCTKMITTPVPATDTTKLIAQGTCELRQNVAVPTKRELQRLAALGKLNPGITDAVAGQVSVFVYRGEAARTAAADYYVKYVCNSGFRPPTVAYFEGPNWMVIAQGADPEVLSALDGIFGEGTVRAPCV